MGTRDFSLALFLEILSQGGPKLFAQIPGTGSLPAPWESNSHAGKRVLVDLTLMEAMGAIRN